MIMKKLLLPAVLGLLLAACNPQTSSAPVFKGVDLTGTSITLGFH